MWAQFFFLVDLFIIVYIAYWIFHKYNFIIELRLDTEKAWSNILTEIQRRTDLIEMLSFVVDSYAVFEKGTMQGVIRERGSTVKPNLSKNLKSDLFKNFSKLLMLQENYPQLKSVEQYKALSDELKATENRINASRTMYNEIANDYNVFISTFPNMIVTKIFGFKKQKYFEILTYSLDSIDERKGGKK